MLLLTLLACECDTIWYIDADEDGFGNALQGVQSCEAPFGYVREGGDCLDSDAAVNPDAEEVCDNVDNDCDEGVDEGVAELWYRDRDGDGHGSNDESAEDCDPGAGWVSTAGDCDDFALAVNPDAEEICDNVDQDCDDVVDEGVSTTWYVDQDNDDYGDDDNTVQACTEQAGVSDVGGDCDDGEASVNPGAVEVCDDLDNNCDGSVDEGVLVTFYADGDNDGWALESADTVEGCVAPSGYTANVGDCDDADNTRSPGETEDCTDGIDNDCDGLADCEDGDCATQNGCYEADCTDGIDGDDDGLVDCLDDDCWTESDCVSHAYAQVTDGTYTITNANNQQTFYGIPWSSSARTSVAATSVAGVLKVYGDFGVRSCDWEVGAMSWSRSSGFYGLQVSGPNRNSFAVDSACPWTSSSFLPPKLEPTGSQVITKTDSLVWYQGSGSWTSSNSTYTTYLGLFTVKSNRTVWAASLNTGSDWYWLPN